MDKNKAWYIEIDGWGFYNIPEPLYTKEQIQKFKVLKVIELNEYEKNKNATNHPGSVFL